MPFSKSTLFLTLLLGACSIAPIKNIDTELAREIRVPQQWMLAAAKQSVARQQAWWQQFASAELNALMQQAMLGNQDLKAAALTWQRARLALDSQALAQSISTNGNLGANAAHHYGTNSNSSGFSASFSAAYQLDLWQKLAATTQTAAWNADASAQDMLAARLSLQGEVANAWLQLLYAQAQLELNQAQIAYQEQTYRLVGIRLSEGAASELEHSNAKQALSALAISKRSLEAEIEQAQITLSILLGQAPQSFISSSRLSDIVIEAIAPQLPAALLHQRPDLRAAQYRLQADLGNIAVAERDFYPDINLNGGISGSSDILGDLLRNPIASLAGSISLPFLQQRERNLALQNAQTQYQANLANFTQTLYRAFADVEKALSKVAESDDNAAHIAARLKNAQKIERLSQIRYQAGADSLQTLLDAQQSRREIESAMLDNRYQRISRRIALALALGGSENLDNLYSLTTQRK